MYKAISWAENAVKNGLITQDQADDYVALIKYYITNPQGLTVSDGWSVKDKNGKEAGFFTTEAEADAYLRANPGFTKGAFEKNHVSVGGGGTPTPITIPDTQLGEAEEFDKVMEGIPSEAPAEFSDWYDLNMWKEMGKPKDYDSIKKWLSSPTNITTYLEKKYSSKTPSINKLKAEEKQMVVTAMIQGNEELKKLFEYPADNGKVNLLKESLSDSTKTIIESDGSITCNIPEKQYHNVVDYPLVSGQVLTFKLPSGETKTVLLDGAVGGKNEFGYEATDLKTGAKVYMQFNLV
jgi:hypothetical protein